jgi:hypothetical protein
MGRVVRQRRAPPRRGANWPGSIVDSRSRAARWQEGDRGGQS